MNPDIKSRWLSALRSGQYTQGVGTLCRQPEGSSREFCCLGVLVDVAFGDQWRDRLEWSHYKSSVLDHPVAGAHSTLIPRVRHDLGLTDKAHENLVDFNDVRRKSFSAIADWIETNL